MFALSSEGGECTACIAVSHYLWTFWLSLKKHVEAKPNNNLMMRQAGLSCGESNQRRCLTILKRFNVLTALNVKHIVVHADRKIVPKRLNFLLNTPTKQNTNTKQKQIRCIAYQLPHGCRLATNYKGRKRGRKFGGKRRPRA